MYHAPPIMLGQIFSEVQIHPAESDLTILHDPARFLLSCKVLRTSPLPEGLRLYFPSVSTMLILVKRPFGAGCWPQTYSSI